MASNYTKLFDQGLLSFFQDAVRIVVRDPSMAVHMFRTLRNQQAAAARRAEWGRRGVHVPQIIIASVTHRCNLNCKGCYALAQHPNAEEEMSTERLCAVLDEASELGVSIVMLAGGEPLVRPDILDIAGRYPQIIFPLFTNGLLVDDAMIECLERRRNLIPLISLEGHAGLTDERRGSGVHEHAIGLMAKLLRAGVFFGTSITVTRSNFELVTGDGFADQLLQAGCRVFIYVEYVPIQPGTEDLVLAPEQKAVLTARMQTLKGRLPGLFVAFPGDEEIYGGCLAAGRGFIHISPEGRVEPCPFAPYSDSSLRDMTLRDALASDFLRTIRESEAHLGESKGGCALWENREWVASVLNQVKSGVQEAKREGSE